MEQNVVVIESFILKPARTAHSIVTAAAAGKHPSENQSTPPRSSTIMPLPTKWHKKKKPPEGFDYVEPILEALENELRDKVKESNLNKRKKESMWPIHQINWQKTRYIYDMYYTHKRISKKVYQYIVDQKLVDAALIAKWKKPGYERLCSTYVINPSNYKFGTSSLCRVPWFDRTEDQKTAKDPTVSDPMLLVLELPLT